MRSWNLQRRRSQGELPRLHELERAVQSEIRDVRGREEMFLRSTSELTLLVKKLGRIQGHAYFRYVLRDVFGDKSKLYGAEAPHAAQQVCWYAKSVVRRLARGIKYLPLVLRASCHYMLTEFRKAFPECRQDTRIVVGGLLFLRILCPALINPEMFDFPAHTATSLSMGVQIAKILQHTLTGTPVCETNTNVGDSNTFIFTYQPLVANFLLRFSQIRPGFAGEVPHHPSVRAAASWDCSATTLMPTTPTASDMPPSPDSDCGSWDVDPKKMRGMSMSTDDVTKHKRRFSLRFWSRNSGIGQRPTP
ncbi:hypothetical protein BBJ28_00022970 [Nothophytophthora sp. Chile5]|nr:hypothetical protein BBJ28_00022970 [Nothophytophthora sp. Chile5]